MSSSSLLMERVQWRRRWGEGRVLLFLLLLLQASHPQARPPGAPTTQQPTSEGSPEEEEEEAPPWVIPVIVVVVVVVMMGVGIGVSVFIHRRYKKEMEKTVGLKTPQSRTKTNSRDTERRRDLAFMAGLQPIYPPPGAYRPQSDHTEHIRGRVSQDASLARTMFKEAEGSSRGILLRKLRLSGDSRLSWTSIGSGQAMKRDNHTFSIGRQANKARVVLRDYVWHLPVRDSARDMIYTPEELRASLGKRSLIQASLPDPSSPAHIFLNNSGLEPETPSE